MSTEEHEMYFMARGPFGHLRANTIDILLLTIVAVYCLFAMPSRAESAAVPVDEAIAKALRIAGVDSASVKDSSEIASEVVPFESAGTMPESVRRSFSEDSLWQVTISKVLVRWEHGNPVRTLLGLKTITVYLGRQTGRFVKAEMSSGEGCAAPIDAWNWPSPPYKFLESSHWIDAAAVDPVPDENILAVFSENKSHDPMSPCKVEVFSLSYALHRGQKRTMSTPPDSIPVWGVVYKYYSGPIITESVDTLPGNPKLNVHLFMWRACPKAKWTGLYVTIIPPWIDYR